MKINFKTDKITFTQKEARAYYDMTKNSRIKLKNLEECNAKLESILSWVTEGENDAIEAQYEEYLEEQREINNKDN